MPQGSIVEAIKRAFSPSTLRATVIRLFNMMASPSEPPAFARSLRAFKDRLSSRDIEAFDLATYEDLKTAVDAIQKEQSQRQGFRNLNKIRPLLEFLQQYSRVIEQFVTAKADFLAFVWVGVRLFMLSTTGSLLVQGSYETVPPGEFLQRFHLLPSPLSVCNTTV